MEGTRWAAIAGIVFVVLFIAGVFALGDMPMNDASDEEVTSYLDDSFRHAWNIVGFYLWVLAGLCFLWFLSHLRTTLHQAEGEPGNLARLGFAGGVLFIAFLIISGAAIGTVPGAVELGDTPKPDPDLARFFPQLGYGLLLVGGAFASIVLILTTSVLTLRTGVFPKWTAWLGFVAALALLFAAVFIPMIALPIWVLAVSAVLLFRQPAGASAAAT